MVYAWPLSQVFLTVAFAILLWVNLYLRLGKKQWKIFNMAVIPAALYVIYRMTVAGRACSDSHVFVWASGYSNEFWREMIMNAFLYVPLGLSLTAMIGPWSVLVALLCSVSIETWQYFAGTGLAQGTDVIMNTLGCAIGAIPWFLSRGIEKKR